MIAATDAGMPLRRAVWARRPLSLLALFCVVLWLPGIVTLPPLDRDESRFAQSSKQMLETGNLIDIRFGEVPRYKKPAGIYWLQAATTEIAGFGARNEIWTYRLTSLLGGIAAVWLLFWCVSGFAPAEEALIAAALLGASLLLTAESTIATTDAVLLAATLAAQAVLLRIYAAARDETRKAPSRLIVLGGWAALGASILVKGPVGAGVVGLTAAVLSMWDRDWGWLRKTKPLSGLVLAAVIVAPWATAIALESHGAFYQQALGHDFAAKIAGGQESHGAPPGYYLVLVTVTLWPVTLFAIPGLANAVRRRTDPVMRFALVWLVGNWVMFELVPTKLPHYVLPVYPALAILGSAWASGAHRQGRERAVVLAAAAQFLLGLVALAAAPVALAQLYGNGASVLVVAISAAGLALGILAVALLLRSQPFKAAAAAIAAALVLYLTLTVGVAPGLDALWVSKRVAVLANRQQRPGDPPPVLAGFEEPSLVFLLGTKTRLSDGEGAAVISGERGGLALVEDRDSQMFLAQAARQGSRVEARGSVSGLNYSKGRHVRITVYRVVPAHSRTVSAE